MLSCPEFEDYISDYIELALPRPRRRSFAEHLLACHDCHGLFNDVRDTLAMCQSQVGRVAETSNFPAIEQRLVNATPPGELFSCRTLDTLISDYFDGLIEGRYEDLFNLHFALCESCHQLVRGVRESLEQENADVPEQLPEHLYARIFAVTSGARQ
ncbi:MAG: zf-HC2 domain-containing protein [Blastocatellia bacterium]